MRILLTIHHELTPDAGAPVTWHPADHYRSSGHQVDVFQFGRLPGRLRGRTAALVFPEAVASRALVALHRGVDVIDASTGDAWLAFALARRLPRRPLLVTRSHGLEHVARDRLVDEVHAGGIRVSWKYPLYHGGFRLWEVARSLRAAYFFPSAIAKLADRAGYRLDRWCGARHDFGGSPPFRRRLADVAARWLFGPEAACWTIIYELVPEHA